MLPAFIAALALSPATVIGVPVATVWTSPKAAVTMGPPSAWPGLATAQRRALVGRIQTQALLGDRVVALRRAGAWTKVVLPDQPSPKDRRGYPGWIRTAELTPGASNGTNVVVTATTAPVTSRGRTVLASYGTRLRVVRFSGSRTTVALPRNAVGTVGSKDVTAHPPTTAPAIVGDAQRFVGVRYLWGGTSAYGWDCSGLVHMVFRAHGITIPRDADAQATGGTPVARDALRPGDLVFYGVTHVHHVALYVGGGRMVEAPNSASSVRVVPLRVADYSGARRYLP